MRYIKFIYIMLAGLLTAACSRSGDFHLEVASDDIGTQNVKVVYFSNGTYQTKNLNAIDGKFSVDGTVDGPSYLEVYTSNGALLGTLIVEGGDDIKARLSALNPENISVEGSDDSESLLKFLADNRENIAKNNFDQLNHNIEEFVRKNPDDYLSTVLMGNFFHYGGYEELALELLNLLPEKNTGNGVLLGVTQLLSASLSADTTRVATIYGFCEADSALTVSTAHTRLNVLLVTDDRSRAADSVSKMLSALRAGANARKLAIYDLGCDRDTIVWHSSLRNIPESYPDSVNHLWLPAAEATPEIAALAPSDRPYFVLTDSLGKVLYRGASASALRAAFGQHRK